MNITARDLGELETAVIELREDAPIEHVAIVRNAVKFAGQECRRIGKMLDDNLIERITASGQDLVLSPTCRLYIGTAKSTDERDRVAVLDAAFAASGARQAVLEAAGGDETVLEAVGRYHAMLDRWLCSGPFKPSAVRAEFDLAGTPDVFDQLFATEAKQDLKEGKPLKKLVEMNPQFVG